ncbi:HD-GYP domain-containing protein [Marinospirillum alkaliphilum]|uniref:HD domain-containing protein n=1 Tax=Marinospirillum alkaliphilum DSM 21637 TaxID=1122209 RepID=A0A1K1WPQ5_9GAMM|nr:HD-GYP domain-containing protein [Marinospirillum alkaliphilum]SFX39099.1 HD domain-containing protein [Marinospirillum alkaliphilum DSM 21637]
MQNTSLVRELNRFHSLPEKLRHLGMQLRTRHSTVERFSVALYHPTTDQVRTFFTTSDISEAITGYDFRLKDAWSLRQIALNRHPRVINDLTELVPPRQTGRINPHTLQLVQQGWRASFTAPLLCSDELLGFVFFNSHSPFTFKGDLLNELELYSQLIAQLIHQEHAAVRTLTAAVRSTMSLCAGRDPETGGHLERMAQYALLIARHLEPKWSFSDRQLQHLLLFAPLHDLGKLATPDRILLKQGKLTPEEFSEMKQHTLQGVVLLDRVIENHGLEYLPDVQMLKNIVLYHHEKMDGTGYPEGLQGEHIPIEARIIAVADVFDALTSERPYKKPWPVERALSELQHMAGTHLDPDCVDALVQHHLEASFILEQLQSDVVEA